MIKSCSSRVEKMRSNGKYRQTPYHQGPCLQTSGVQISSHRQAVVAASHTLRCCHAKFCMAPQPLWALVQLPAAIHLVLLALNAKATWQSCLHCSELCTWWYRIAFTELGTNSLPPVPSTHDVRTKSTNTVAMHEVCYVLHVLSMRDTEATSPSTRVGEVSWERVGVYLKHTLLCLGKQSFSLH